VTIVWIAPEFTDEHRAAMQWLNDKTVEGIGFFALEVERRRIGDTRQEADWPRQHKFLAAKAVALHHAFDPQIQERDRATAPDV
jgi:hypothetical protein